MTMVCVDDCGGDHDGVCVVGYDVHAYVYDYAGCAHYGPDDVHDDDNVGLCGGVHR